VLEAARKRSEESTPGYNAFQAWNAVRKARDALGGKTHVGLRFAQILAVTVFGGLFGLAVEADRGKVPVEWARLKIATENRTGEPDETTRWGVLIAQTSAGVHLAVRTPSAKVPRPRRPTLVFFPTSRVRELRTHSVKRKTKAVPGTIAEQLTPLDREWVVALGSLGLLLVGTIFYRRATTAPSG